jgi:hypothetical protein
MSSPTFYNGKSTAAKTHPEQEISPLQPIQPYEIGFQSYENGLPPVEGEIDYDEIRLSRISALKKPDLKPSTRNYNLNSIEEEDNSGDYEYNARFSNKPNPEYYYTYKDRTINAKTNESTIVRSPSRGRQLVGYRSSENIDPNLPYMNGGQIRRPPPTSPKRGRAFSLAQ